MPVNSDGSWTHKYKPAASIKTHLLMAAFAWMAVGGALLIAGTVWARSGGIAYGYVGIAVAVGLIKARFILDRTARKAVARIKERGDGKCIGGFFSVRSWLLVLIMITLGQILRSGILPVFVVGLIYSAIGASLFYSSRCFWDGYLHE